MGAISVRCAELLLCCAGLLRATPVLRLSQTVVQAFAVTGQPPPFQTLVASNGGDGTLTVGLSIPEAVTWLTAQVSPCNQPPGCTSIQFNFNAANLATGTYSASVTVFAPGALDSPQTVIVILSVNAGSGSFENPIDAWLTAGSECGIQFGPYQASCPANASITTQDGDPWLELSFRNATTIQCFGTYYVAVLSPPANLPPGNYSGTIAPPGASQTVNLQVVPQPMAVPTPGLINMTLAQGQPAVAYPFVPAISLSADAAISATSASVSGRGISASVVDGKVHVAVDPGSLGPGTYNGAVVIGCLTPDCPVIVPVTLTIVASGPPQILQLLDNVTFAPGPVAPGEVVVIRGQNFTSSAPAYASGLPLPTTLAGASVLVNGAAAPLYYVSANQIALELPTTLSSLPPNLVQVAGDGQTGPVITPGVVPYAPQIAAITDAAYNPVDAYHPAHAGETMVLWAFGLGITDPAVPDGAAAPANPPATTVTVPAVQFGSTIALPIFTGLSPGSAGLYQVNVTIPAATPPGILAVKLIYSNAAVIRP